MGRILLPLGAIAKAILTWPLKNAGAMILRGIPGGLVLNNAIEQLLFFQNSGSDVNKRKKVKKKLLVKL